MAEDEEEHSYLNRALATLSFAVEKTRPTPKLQFRDILTNAQDNVMERKRRASLVPPTRRVSMNELQAELYTNDFDFDFPDDGEDQEDDEEPPAGAALAATAPAARSFLRNHQSFKDLQRRTATRPTMELTTTTSDPVVAAIKDRRRLMQDVKPPPQAQQSPTSPSRLLVQVPSLMRSPSQLSPSSSQALSPNPLSCPSPLSGPNNSAELLLERLHSIKPVASRRFSSIDLGRPSRLSHLDGEAPEVYSSSLLTPSSVLGSTSGLISVDGGGSAAESPSSLSSHVSLRLRSLSGTLGPERTAASLRSLSGSPADGDPRSGAASPVPLLHKLAAGPHHRGAVRRNSLACLLPRRLGQGQASLSGMDPLGRAAGADTAGLGSGFVSPTFGLKAALQETGNGSNLRARLRRQSQAFCPNQSPSLGGGESLPAATSLPASLAMPADGASGGAGAEEAGDGATRLPRLPRNRL